MKKVKKRHYVAPTTTLCHVQVESPICGGSVDMTATAPGAQTEAQVVNSTFESNNDFTTGSDTKWDN